jgi:hypothetical protein
MKFTDVRTLNSFLKEYGMDSGTSTYGSNKSSITAPATGSKSPSTAPSASPTTKKSSQSPTTTGTGKNSVPKILAVRASDVPADAIVKDIKDKPMGKVVSRVGKKPKADALVVDTGKPGNKQYQVLDKDQKVFIDNPEYQEESKATKLLSKLKIKSKKVRSIKKILRNSKFNEQREVVFEINFNDPKLAKGALAAPISCGFEAETTWPGLDASSDGDDDFLDGLDWSEIEDLVYDQEGSRSVRQVEEAFREWLGNSDYFYDAESEVIGDMVDERKRDMAYITEYAYQELGADEVEDYKNETLDGLSSDEKEDYADWDEDRWAKELIDEKYTDEFDEWLADQIRDNAEHWDDAWEKVLEQYEISDWVNVEYSGNWYRALSDLDIFLVNPDSGGGVEAVAAELEPWAEKNSQSNDVRSGDYHSGKGVDNDYWRVEEDSSIQADGAAAEIISPVYTTPQAMMSEMKSLFEFFKAKDVETNESTGLHVTMSWNGEQTEPNKLKMAVLLGDKYLLSLFDREDNTYTQSQFDRVKQGVSELMKNPSNLKTLAAVEEILSSKISENKFSSINFKDATNSDGNQLIEFRIGGGDDYHTKLDSVLKSVIRYSAIMQAGHDPNAFRKDYILALYRLIRKESDVDVEKIKSMNIAYGDAGKNPMLAALQSSSHKNNISSVTDYLTKGLELIAKAKEMYKQQPQGDLFMPKESVNEDDGYAAAESARLYDLGKQTVLTALAITAMDIGSGLVSAPKATHIAAIRKGVKELGFTTSTLWQGMLSSSTILNIAHERGLDNYELQDSLSKGLTAMLKTNLGVQPAQPKAVIKYKAGDVIYVNDDNLNAVQHGQPDPSMFLIVPPEAQSSNDAFKEKFGIEKWSATRLMDRDLKNITAKTGIKFMKESIFTQFDKLSLEEQLKILERVDANKLNEAWSKKQKRVNEKKKSLRNPKDNPCWDGYKPVGTKKKNGKTVPNCVPESVEEGAVPDNRKIRILNKIMSKPLLASDIGAQMEAFFAIPDPLMVNEFRKQRAIAGDNVDLRPVVKGFINNSLHPDVQKHVNINESVVKEYDDLGKEKQVIIKTVSGLDATDKQQASVLDRIYKILNSGQISTNIDVAFTKPLVDENLPEAEKSKIRKDMTRIIAGLEQDYGSMKKFLDRLEQAGGVVNIKELAKPLNTFANVFGDDVSAAAFITLANYGVGKKQKGPGEYALACLSNQIKLAEGEGDLQINGIGKTELKAALSSAGGRIGYGGGSQKAKRAVINKYSKYIPTVLERLNAGTGGSISIRPFIDALNTDLPTNTPDNVKVRKALMSALLTMDLEKFAAPVVEKFATSMNFDEIETEYMIQNFAWYKDRDDFDALLLIHIPNRKTAMIRNAEDLIAFRNSGHAKATSISIVPTQAGAGREQWAQLTLNKSKVG